MRIEDIVWLPAIVEKLYSKHAIETTEVEDVLLFHPMVEHVERGHRPGENLYSAMGQTGEGRYIVVFFVLKSNRQALVISARDMTTQERRRYVGYRG